ncbi:hypothetical protein OCV99_04535 [Dorea acetigenes]|uniref:S-layer homology domain-containing protein n=1 Tax=Dorea acetigenes TaxID=2981787 RepID=A0ABT2RKY2_9FIRM|nr:hypothetical protein [Dorea acetigenes]MCU6685834.1 hypothetical protein [Dorea acetigenes]
MRKSPRRFLESCEQILLGKDEGKKLHPQGQTTRAECAAIIQRFTEKYK